MSKQTFPQFVKTMFGNNKLFHIIGLATTTGGMVFLMLQAWFVFYTGAIVVTGTIADATFLVFATVFGFAYLMFITMAVIKKYSKKKVEQ
jgi:hypothetical protein